MVSADRYSGRIRGGARSRRENGRGRDGTKPCGCTGIAGGREGTAARLQKGGERGPEDEPTCTAPRGVEAPPSAWQRRRAIARGCRARPARDEQGEQRHPLAAPLWARVFTGTRSIVRALVSALASPAPSSVRPGDTRSCTHSRISFEKNNIFPDPPTPPPHLCKLARGRGRGRGLWIITGDGRGRAQPLAGGRSDVTHMTP